MHTNSINKNLLSIVALLTVFMPSLISLAEETKPAKTPIGADNPASKIYLGADGKPAGRGIPEQPPSEAVRIGKGHHPDALSLPGLPKDKYGLINWDLMVRQELIKPIDSLQPDAPPTPMLDLSIVIPVKSDFVNNVIFRHSSHLYWLDCNNCHPAIFVMERGKNNMNMQGIAKGKWCGRCHGKVSFPLTDCKRCHAIPKS